MFPPLGTTDYSSFVQQSPIRTVDGYFWVVGGTGTKCRSRRSSTPRATSRCPARRQPVLQPGPRLRARPGIAGAYVGGFASLPGDVKTPEIEAYLASADATWDDACRRRRQRGRRRRVAMGFGFGYGYYVAGKALNQALKQVGPGDPNALQAALGVLTLEVPYGPVTLDENRQGIITTYVQQLVLDEDDEVVSRRSLVPDVDQSFGGTLKRDRHARP